MISGIEIERIGGGLALLVISAVLSNALIVLLRPWLRQYALARPNARSSHATPTPQGGGIAVVAATLVAAGFMVVKSGLFDAETAAGFWQVAAATAVIAVIGAVDDIRTIAIAPRLFLQTIAVAAVIAALPADMRLLPIFPSWTERVVLLLVGVWYVNLVNFMDGIDWMTVAEVVPVTAGIILISFFANALPALSGWVALALCGAIIGFAPFNRPVAKLFLGDVGSLPIGLLLFWLLVLLAGSGHIVAALILPLYYLADTTLTLLRRMFDGDAFWQAHRSHFYQKATDRGFSVLEVIARVVAVNLTLAVLATMTVLVPGRTSSIAALACSIMLVSGLLYSFVRGKR